MVSEANTSEHWLKRSKRHKKQKGYVNIFFNQYKHLVELPVSIIMCRISPRTLDFDNLVYSLKWVRDALAEGLIQGLAPGRADEDDRITWVYAQEKGNPKEYAVRIEILSGK
jgi:hypothetical protein